MSRADKLERNCWGQFVNPDAVEHIITDLEAFIKTKDLFQEYYDGAGNWVEHLEAS